MGRVGKTFDTIGKWVVLTPAFGLGLIGLWMLTAPGTDLSRRAFAERLPGNINGVAEATVRGRVLSIRAYLDCPADLSASTQIAIEREGFSSARCSGPNGVRNYDLPLPISSWFYFAVACGVFGFVRARRAKSAPMVPERSLPA